MPRWLARILSVGPIAWLTNWGRCGRCHITWKYVEPHETLFEQDSEGNETAAFALCEHCWSKLTPQQRLPYYIKAHFSSSSKMEWAAIKEQVLLGN